MQTIEWETDISGDTLIIPDHIKAQIGDQRRHIKIIILVDESESKRLENKAKISHFSCFRGIANTELSTNEIMAMTRGKS